MSSISYYNTQAQTFFERTINADISDSYKALTPLLPYGSKILDAGCGSGRDALYFKNKNYHVEAFDGSSEMVRLSTELLQQPTKLLQFHEMNYDQEFDAIWAQASLLHVPYEELSAILDKMHQALKTDGYLYASFKYGYGKRLSEDRTFYDMDEEHMMEFLNPKFNAIKLWQSDDTRSTVGPSPSKKWLHVIAQKK
ncbi:MAG: class I SAM-dependent methyltransferase [Parachlamydiales bacterium]|nr:class I SAM-dependent methyltransferase [Parachlamydiales bacterium]